MSHCAAATKMCQGPQAAPCQHGPFRLIEGGAARPAPKAAGKGRRQLLACLLIACSLMGGWLIADLCRQTRIAASLQAASQKTVVVHQGDTLWGLAQEHPLEGCTTEELVRYIREANNLKSSSLCVGSRLVVPALPDAHGN